MMLVLAWLSLIVAAVAVAFCLINRTMFQRAPVLNAGSADDERPVVSLLIPARNEQAGIEDTLQRALAQQDVELEVLVLDDNSTDGTGEVVQRLARQDHRLKLLPGRPLPSGWSGKQFACQQLADAASHEELVFLDADVHLKPDAVIRAIRLRRRMQLDLLSGFPLQRAETPGERLLIPLINYILLCYLPFPAMRGSTSLSACAGCGQLFVTGRTAWRLAGGHAAIRRSLHDGVMLPRAYRRAGLMTDVFDASDMASVRMYQGLQQTWQGLAKNATEGFANSRLILPVTALMTAAHVLPFVLMPLIWFESGPSWAMGTATAAAGLSLLTRAAVAAWFDRQWLVVPLHPVSIILFLSLQWFAWIRSLRGSASQWRGRSYTAVKELSS